MPIHYDTIEDGQNKKSHLLFSFLVRIVLFLHFIGGIYFVKNIIGSFHSLHLNNYTPYENKCFNPRNQNHRMAFVTHMNFVCVHTCHVIRGLHAVKYATTSRNCWTRYPSWCSNGWAEFWPDQWNFFWHAEPHPLTKNLKQFYSNDFERHHLYFVSIFPGFNCQNIITAQILHRKL